MDRLTLALFFSSSLIILLSSSAVLAVPSPSPLSSGGDSCDHIVSLLSPCLNYLRKKEDKPSQSCCDGAMKLNEQAKTKKDRRAACQCLKDALTPISDVDPSRIPLIPEQCRISATMPLIDRNIDCSRIP
ncbi:hypothetical protein TIFTF001_012135 [Ficus carica]|uniref:Non-specific lipid-transfer protein n=1 Tax=Ficus carica TaxID=3494 RepID=A0AA88ABR9_FICCA|nr:hypothetical protein TIFTF001_012135 [Ficus carica]